MRKTESEEEERKRQLKLRKEREREREREISTVASSFGLLFGTSKYKYFTPVNPTREQHFSSDTFDEQSKLKRKGNLSPSAVEKLRDERIEGLLLSHTTLTRSQSAKNLLPSSIHDIERPLRTFASMRAISPIPFTAKQTDLNDEKDKELMLQDREAKYYLGLCQTANVAPISKLLNTIAPLATSPIKKNTFREKFKASSLPTQKNNRNKTRSQKVLNLKGKGLTVKSLDILSKTIIPSFVKNGLSEVNLSDNRIGVNGVKVLLHSLENGKSPQLKHLDLSSCNLCNKGAIEAINLLLPSTENNLSTLKLANNDLGEKFTKKFCQIYKSAVLPRRKADLTRLVHLDLRQNNIGEQGGIMLGNVIGECGSALETLLLGWNHVGSRGADEILAGFVRVKPVTRISCLDLSMNSIDYLNNLQVFFSGTRMLTLIALNLSHNQLGPKAAEDLVTALSIRNRVQELEIGFNPLGLMGTARIVEACRQNALRTLRIENTIMKTTHLKSSSSSSSSADSSDTTKKDANDDNDEDVDDLEHFDLSADVQYVSFCFAHSEKKSVSMIYSHSYPIYYVF
jgi:hypothetical protein